MTKKQPKTQQKIGLKSETLRKLSDSLRPDELEAVIGGFLPLLKSSSNTNNCQ